MVRFENALKSKAPTFWFREQTRSRSPGLFWLASRVGNLAKPRLEPAVIAEVARSTNDQKLLIKKLYFDHRSRAPIGCVVLPE